MNASEITKDKNGIKIFKQDISNSLDMCFGKIKDCEESLENNDGRLGECKN